MPKTRSTYWTAEKITAFRQAQTGSEAEILAAADNYLTLGLDNLWSFVTSQKVPRACGIVPGEKDWQAVPGVPWKLTDGRLTMPTNDFAAYYASGLDETGCFDPDHADKNLLVNQLYPEKGEKWGVDDGYGWVDESGATRVYIAFYNHYTVWYEIRKMVSALSRAYLLCGDARYATAGAVLLDRIADVYPDMDLASLGPQFYNSHGGTGEGGIVGSIWETGLVADFIRAYDAFFPALLRDDRELLVFLGAQARRYKLPGDKSSMAGICAHIEEGTVRRVLPGVMQAKIRGNFGMHQQALTLSAVVVDEPQGYTQEALDFVFRPGGLVREQGRYRVTGGDVLGTLVGQIDRDGHGFEASPGYNSLHVNGMKSIVEALGGYEGYTGIDLARHPKYLKMLDTRRPLYMLDRYLPSIGDTGKTGAPAGEVAGIAESVNLTGYGFAALRAGSGTETARGVWLYYGRNGISHAHSDALNIDIYGCGLDLSPDLGYPEVASHWPHRGNWSGTTVSHNLVVVDRGRQKSQWVSQPQHFVGAGPVQLIDIAAPQVYPQTAMYRRTLAMIDVDATNSYYVDFFRVKGGDEHHYMFHGAEGPVTTCGLQLTAQPTGTYAGADVPYADTAYNASKGGLYNDGFNYLFDVAKDGDPPAQFTADWAVTDTWGVRPEKADIHLRLTMVGQMDDVALAAGRPPQMNQPGNPEKLRYLIAHRRGQRLDSLFAAVIQPYEDRPFISSIQPVSVITADETAKHGAGDELNACALRVTLPGGRVEYIISTLAPDTTYLVDGRILFRGVFGVYTEVGGQPTGGFLHDGTLLGLKNQPLIAAARSSAAGTVVDFTRDAALENEIVIRPADPVDPAALPGCFIYIDNDGERNAAYRIVRARQTTEGLIVLNIGDITLIRRFADQDDTSRGYVYDIAPGASCRAPFTWRC